MTDSRQTILDIITQILTATDDSSVTNEMVGRVMRYLQEKDEADLATIRGNIDAQIGTIYQALNGYYTKAQIHSLLSSNYYEMADIDNMLSGKLNISDETTVAEINSLF